MRRGYDVAVGFPGLHLVHHNLPGKKVDWHQWPQHSLFVPLQGEVRIQLDAKILVAGTGKLIYIPPRTRMLFESSEAAGERFICLLDDATFPELTRIKPEGAVCQVTGPCKELLAFFLLKPQSRAVPSLIAAFVLLVTEMLADLAHPHRLATVHLEGTVHDERLRKALAVLQRDVALPLRMTQVARECGLSVRNLRRLFAEQVGLAPKQVLTQIRLEAIWELIASGMPVGEAARTCGYRSLASFIKQFRRFEGQLPSEAARFGRKH